LDPNSPLSKQRNVYFDYDNFSIKKEYQALIELHGKFLAQNPGVSIRVEGNADERGGSEYNLALGQKRAEAVAAALKVYGVKAAQVEATSWGKEKPKATGNDEASWAQNRRGDLVYPSK
jgi:peptidoglycan-associated lipoprotein